MADPDLLRRIEALSLKIRKLGDKALMQEQKERALYATKYIEWMGYQCARDAPLFDVEPWHPLRRDLPLMSAGEMLLRVKDGQGQALAPYPAVMAFYSNGFTEEFDIIICLCALEQFKRGEDRQVSINISCRSMQNADFVKSVLSKIEAMRIRRDQKIILEIHESNAVMEISDKTSKLFKKLGVQFAIDDVGLSINDVFRLSAFEGVADYIKLDRQSVSAHPEDPRSLAHILSLARSFLPNAQMVAEGIQNAQHAYDVMKQHPDVCYVQGLYLPDRATFAKQWKDVLAGAQS